MTYTHFLGIDPGHSGALALLSASGEYAKVWPMPVCHEPPEIDKTELRVILSGIKRFPRVLAGLEWPNTWAGQFGDVVRHAETFGRGKGTLDASLFLLGFEYKRVQPSIWKGRLGLPGKSWDIDSVQGAAMLERTYPQHSGLIRGPRGGLLDGPLDALLIAHFIRVTTLSPVGRKGGRRPPTYRGVPKEWLEEI